jgi:hypothetical protein
MFFRASSNYGDEMAPPIASKAPRATRVPNTIGWKLFLAMVYNENTGYSRCREGKFMSITAWRQSEKNREGDSQLSRIRQRLDPSLLFG